jgi:NAD(P)-dependent dehydrogenase (short-subunit alcohol dehydrogenase family)
MARRIAGKVVVVTGASSGIGRATALAFAVRGARLVLASRHEPALREVADQCHRLGASTLVVPTDVRDEAAVKLLASRAAETFGGIDAWVNNAGVYLLGRFEDVPGDAFRQLLDTNLFGYVHGARAALPHLRASGGGVIVNVASLASGVGLPQETAYASSKAAVRAFSESLRQELRADGIDVVTILPATIDTPLIDHGANFSGLGARPLQPVHGPESVAATIVARVARPRPEAVVGTLAHASRLLRTVLPASTFERLATRQAERQRFTRQPADSTLGNLAAPRPPFAVAGGWRNGHRKGRRLRKLAFAGLLLAAVPALAGFAAFTARARQRQRLLARLFS